MASTAEQLRAVSDFFFFFEKSMAEQPALTMPTVWFQAIALCQILKTAKYILQPEYGVVCITKTAI